MKKVTILIPCYNEEQSLPLLYEQLSSLMDSHKEYDWELLFVNDGSKDHTIGIIRQLRKLVGVKLITSIYPATLGKKPPCWQGLIMQPVTV